MSTRSTSSSPKRHRLAWLIGVVVLIGVGAMVVGNWNTIRIKYYVRCINSLDEEAADLIEILSDKELSFSAAWALHEIGAYPQMYNDKIESIRSGRDTDF